MIKALLLDLDNTLIRRGAAVDRWVSAHFKEQDRHAIRLLDRWGHTPRDEFCQAVVARWPEWGDAETFWEAFRVGVAEAVQPDPEIDAALAALATRYTLAVVSNGGGDTQRRKLARAGLRFETVIISGEVGFEKPDPRIFQAALDALGLRADEAMMVGDDLQRDIYGACALGIKTCWIAGLPEPRGLRDPADYILDDFPSLPSHLGIRSSTPPPKTS